LKSERETLRPLSGRDEERLRKRKAEPDYVEVVNTETLEPVTSISGEVLVAERHFSEKPGLLITPYPEPKG
jgi:pantothenate synthetase